MPTRAELQIREPRAIYGATPRQDCRGMGGTATPRGTGATRRSDPEGLPFAVGCAGIARCTATRPVIRPTSSRRETHSATGSRAPSGRRSEGAPRLSAPSGSGAQGRERRAALSSVALSPRGVARCRASAKTRSPYEAVNAAIACVSARPAERPRQLAGLPAPALPGCQPLLQRVRGSAPNNPGRRSPSRVGVGGEV
jgi:hypothetical protein